MKIRNIILLTSVLVPLASAQTAIVWDYLSSQETIDKFNILKTTVKYELVEGSGPSTNRMDQFYMSNYREGYSAVPTTNMEDLLADYKFRTDCAADMQLRGLDRFEDSGGMFTEHALLRHYYDRYAPFIKLWRQDSLRLDYPVYDNHKYRNELHYDAMSNTMPDWGVGDYFRYAVTGAGAADTIAGSKICNTPYVSAEGTNWAWLHESAHAHHRISHKAATNGMTEDRIDGESENLVITGTFDPTGGLWGAWHDYKGKGYIDGFYQNKTVGLFIAEVDKDSRRTFKDCAITTQNPGEYRVAMAIHNYYKAFDPLDSHTDNSATLLDPAVIEVAVASTDVIMLKWFITILLKMTILTYFLLMI